MDGEWHTLTAQYDGIPDDNNEIWIRYWKDGEFYAGESFGPVTGPVHVALNGTAHGSNFYIGTDWSNPPRNNLNFIGSIDEVRISNTIPAPILICGDWGYPPGDINKDCYVDLRDMAEVADSWLECTDPNNTDCEPL